MCVVLYSFIALMIISFSLIDRRGFVNEEETTLAYGSTNPIRDVSVTGCNTCIGVGMVTNHLRS